MEFSGVRLLTVIVLIICLFSASADPTGDKVIKFGAIFRYDPNRHSGWNFESVAPAVSLAVERFQAKGGFPDYTFKMIHRNAYCNPGRDIVTISSLRYSKEDRPDVIFGASCSIVIIPLGVYMSYWKMAYFPHGGTDSVLSDKKVFDTLVRIHPSGDKMADAFTNIFSEFGWSRTAMVTSYGFCDLGSRAIYSALKNMGVTITEWIRPLKYGTPVYELGNYLDRIRERARVIISCFDRDAEELIFLKLAYDRGMRAPDFVYLNYGNVPSEDDFTPWISLDKQTPEIVQAWRNLLLNLNYKQVTMAGLIGEKFEKFYDQIPIRLSQPPWNLNISLEMGWRGGLKSVDVHDTVTAWLEAANETMAEGGDWRDGQIIQSKIKNRIVDGLRGRTLFDYKADRVPDYWFLDLQPGQEEYEPVLLMSMAAPPGQRMMPIDGRSIYWGTPDNMPPPDSPVCGFTNEFCQEDGFTRNIGIIGGVIAFIILVFIIILSVYFYRKKKEEEALQNMIWKINFDDINVGKKRAGSVANMSRKSLLSIGSATSKGSENMDEQGTRQLFTEVALYRDKEVAILRVNKPSVNLNMTDLKELKLMKDMKHDNLAVFIGACVDPPNTCYIMQYYNKGSLQDIIENDEIALDWMLKASLLNDLANGLSYLHKSELRSHGSLKSTCCLVDSRWQLKISSYGLHAFRSGQTTADVGEYEKHRRMLWMAPELLRMSEKSKPKYGTQKGDIYSFGVILQEIIYRCMPYFLEESSPEDIIVKLTHRTDPPFRPILPKLDPNDANPASRDLIMQCWDEDPNKRPSIEVVQRALRSLNQGKKIDIVSTLIQKLEAYANNLEEIVTKRTAELVVEKKKTDSLLYRMLPESVADHLKQGKVVKAELFDEVTILFSDIVGFTSLSLASTPIQVVNLLNELYSMFDDIMDLHDVYKVETISDSYMVASGLPRRNGNRNVAEIANLAMDLMHAAFTEFKIKHRPGETLQLRIGIHTGVCAAGVVGLAMPRYCLFGDTVNMASRMETNGKALRIHMSKFAYQALEKIGGYTIRPRGEMQIKGKGLQMTYWLIGREGYNKLLPSFLD